MPWSAMSLGFLLIATAHAGAPDSVPRGLNLRSSAGRAAAVQAFHQRSTAARELAEALAKARGWPIRGELPDGTAFELIGTGDQGFRYLATANANAAISTAADQIRNTAPYHLSGVGYTIGMWDAGSVRATHQEFTLRVINRNPATVHYHSTHVAGTMAASGINLLAQGMAPAVSLDAYDWLSDLSEVAGRAATAPDETGAIHVSNHSYGYVTGWHPGTWYGGSITMPHYFGISGEREDRRFGQYSAEAVAWDELHHAAPYYLAFRAAGNDRDDAEPEPGDTYYYASGSTWVAKTYNPATDPYPDGWDTGGFDTMEEGASAKNLVSVGSVNDAVSGGIRAPASGTMSGFSNWGPADDGRVKPDLVANGASLVSTHSSGDAAYATMTGTSSSTPNACGSALLLVELFGHLFPGEAMRASTLKGLLLDTADDLGQAGPDYSFGWGLMNVRAAADQIAAHAEAVSSRRIHEGLLTATHLTDEFAFRWDGSHPIRATLCWTDPAGTERTGLDDRSPTLVNDLDLRITGPGGNPTHLPFVLDVNNPTVAATTGDNIVDNIEQVRIASPTPGIYALTVSHKGTLADGQQHFSLILSGQDIDNSPPQVVINSPTSGPTFFSATDSMALGGTATDDVRVLNVTWTNDRGGSGTATGTTSWSVSGIVLQPGVNVLTVSARDDAGNVGNDTLTVTYQLPTAVTLTAFTATATAADRATLTWQTGVAVDILGFHVDQADARGNWTRLTTNLVVAEDVMLPRLYTTDVQLPQPAGSERYRLIAVDLRGRERVLAETQAVASLRVSVRRGPDDLVLLIQGAPGTTVILESISVDFPGAWEPLAFRSLDSTGSAEICVPISFGDAGRLYRLRSAP